MDRWASQNGVKIDFSRLGKRVNNAKVDSLKGRLQAACLNARWFL